MGFDLSGHQLRLNPRISSIWREFKIQFHYKTSSYSLVAQRREDADPRQTIYIDDILLGDEVILLLDDGKAHQILVQFATELSKLT